MTDTTLKIAVFPMNIAWANREANLVAVENAMARIDSDTDLLVLPELFTTGFVADPDVYRKIAEPDNGRTLTLLRKLSEKYRMAIAGSHLGCDSDRTEFYNRGFFIEPTGETTYVNKRHLFHVSPEAQILTGGKTSYPVVRFRGWNIALAVCYDLRFPVWCRNVTVHGRPAYDIFLLPANWPQARAVALESLAQARAIENQSYVVVANRSGSDEYGDYDGLSFVYDYIGTRMVTASAGEIIYSIADRDGLQKLRDYMPAGLDSDKFTIHY